jgi:general secretion pathway protein E
MVSLWNGNEKFSLSDAQFNEGAGCEKCLQTGYLGRTGIFELLVVDDDIKELTIRRSASHIIQEAAIERGMSTLTEDGLHKALTGLTTLEEVCRVTQDSYQTNIGVGERVGS